MNPKYPLAAQALHHDPRVAQAKQMLLDAVHAHQKALTGIRPPNPGLKQSYDDLLASYAECRGSKLWFPYLGSGIGNGCFVELLDGSVKYDFISGIGPHCLGHSHPDLIAASIDAALSDLIMQGNLQQNSDAAELSAMLAQAAHMDHCFLSNSGAMANENALKMALQKRHPASRILAFEHCFAGRTIVLSQITDKPSFREGIPLNVAVDYIPFYDAEHPEESTKRAVDTLKSHLARYPKQHAVMCFELVQGENGFYPGSKEFFVALMEILKDNHITVFVDEVQTFGRASELFAFQHFELSEYVDIVSIGKLSQVCATLFNKQHRPRPGLLSQTFIGSTSAIHASKTILKHLTQGNYYGPNGKVMQVYSQLSNNLADISKRHPKLMQGPFGIGAMIAFTPFDGDSQRTTQLVHDLFEAGVISFIAGAQPVRARFLAPFGVVTKQDIDTVCKIVESTLLKQKNGS